MDFKDLSHARYSLRKFSDAPVEQEKLDLILEAARSAPTAHNRQPQRILVCRSEAAKERVLKATPFHFGAPLLLVVACDEEGSWHRECDGKPHGEIATALAIGQMMLQAADLGLGTTYIGVFDPQVLKAELAEELKGLTPLAVLPLGYPREDAHPSRLHAERKPVEELVRYL